MSVRALALFLAPFVVPFLVPFVVLVAWLPLSGLQVVPGAGNRPPSSFMTLEVHIDSGAAPLAAWQVAVAATIGDVRIVGIEGGEHEVYSSAPYYDQRAMMHERVIIAAFSTAAAERLPSGRTRVATIHVQARGEAKPEFEAVVQAAASAGGDAVEAQVTLVERNGA